MAATDILTQAEALAAIQANPSTVDTDLVDRLNTSVTVRIDELCGPVVTRTVTEIRNGGGCDFELYEGPASSVTSVTEYQGTTATVLTADSPGVFHANGYLLRTVGNSSVIIRRSSGYTTRFWPSAQNIVIVYEAGRAADTTAVPARFKDAAAVILRHVWGNEHGSGTIVATLEGDVTFGSSFSFPKRALEILGDDRRLAGIA